MPDSHDTSMDPLASIGLTAARASELNLLLQQVAAAEEAPFDAMDAMTGQKKRGNKRRRGIKEAQTQCDVMVSNSCRPPLFLSFLLSYLVPAFGQFG